jgi:hypothetical protein
MFWFWFYFFENEELEKIFVFNFFFNILENGTTFDFITRNGIIYYAKIFLR